MPTFREAKMMLLFSDASGIYIPQRFAHEMNFDRVTGVKQDDISILSDGPDHEWYWEAWDAVLNDAVLRDTDGTIYTLYQDGDCWAIEQGAELVDGMDRDDRIAARECGTFAVVRIDSDE